MPDPTLRDRLAKIAYEAERGLRAFYGVTWDAADAEDRRRAYRIIDALLASEEWRAREEVLTMAQETWDSVSASYDRKDPMIKRHAAALNDLGVLLARLAEVRGTT